MSKNFFSIGILAFVIIGSLWFLKSSKKTDIVPDEPESQSPVKRQVSSVMQAKSEAPKLSLEELSKKYKTELKVTPDQNLQPYRLTGKILKENYIKNSKRSELDELKELIVSLSSTLNIDHPENLEVPSGPSLDPIGDTAAFKQVYNGIPVVGGQVRVHRNKYGDVIMVNNSFVPGVENIDPVPTVDKALAVSIAASDAKKLDPRDPIMGSVGLVIYQFKSNAEKSLAWEVVVNQPWLKAEHGVGVYYVNAQNKNKFERIEGARH